MNRLMRQFPDGSIATMVAPRTVGTHPWRTATRCPGCDVPEGVPHRPGCPALVVPGTDDEARRYIASVGEPKPYIKA